MAACIQNNHQFAGRYFIDKRQARWWQNKSNMQKILIAIDYAPAAQKVVQQGYALGKAMNAKIILLHVVEDVHYYSTSSYNAAMRFVGGAPTACLSDTAIESIEKDAAVFLNRTKTYLQDEQLETVVVRGEISTSIVATAIKEDCQLIVIGAHYINSLEELYLGNIAHKLLDDSPIPMFIIPIKINKNDN